MQNNAMMGQAGPAAPPSLGLQPVKVPRELLEVRPLVLEVRRASKCKRKQYGSCAGLARGHRPR